MIEDTKLKSKPDERTVSAKHAPGLAYAPGLGHMSHSELPQEVLQIVLEQPLNPFSDAKLE